VRYLLYSNTSAFADKPYSVIAGEPTGSVSGQPPTLSEESKSEILASASKDLAGQNVPGKDNGDSQAAPKVKSQKQRKS
jgi:valyl-tRNA synthetase